MDPDTLRVLLDQVRTGQIAPEQAMTQLQQLPFADLGYARVDHHRHLRQGIPEVVFGEGKTVQQIVGIARALLERHGRALVTRVAPDKAEAVCRELPELEYDTLARVLVAMRAPPRARESAPVVLVTAGTSDLPVAEEAAQTLRFAGASVDRLYDAGVAGIHRLMGEIGRLSAAPVVIVVAGMEGALPSVVGGLIAAPLIAVPTSVGYGAALSGFTALMGMLTSCASGVTVVNIDNGFGAAMAALRILGPVRAKAAP